MEPNSIMDSVVFHPKELFGMSPMSRTGGLVSGVMSSLLYSLALSGCYGLRVVPSDLTVLGIALFFYYRINQ